MVYTKESSRSSTNDNDRAGYRTSNTDSRISRSYRSPPLSSRVRAEEHRSRRDSPPLDTTCLSAFYRERFGDHSPEDYLNLRLSQFDKVLTKEQIKVLLEREFKHLAPFEIQIKIVRNPEDDERLAYVNFERPDCAKSVRRTLMSRLQKVLGRKIAIDPAGVIRDQEGKFIPDRFNRAAMAGTRSSPPLLDRRSARSPTGGYIQHRPRPLPRREQMPVFHLNQDDTQAGRTIFVGNLPGDIRDSELRRIFEGFGIVDDVDIKLLADSNAAYAFILMGTVEEAIQARQGQHNKPLRPGGNRCQLGYGKTQISSRIIIGGLGTWTTKEMLLKEFERYGEIVSVEYELGDLHAFVKYVSTDSAADATSAMKNYPLGGKDKCITIDFAKDSNSELFKSGIRKRGRSQSPDEPSGKRNRGPRTPSVSPSQSPSRAGYFNSLLGLREHVACTWKGYMVLKKTEYVLSLYRVFGREHLIQDYLRDQMGVALRLNINQRLPIVPDLYQKLIDFDRTELALMIAVELDRPIESLVKYLQEKNAAGVVTVEGAVIYVLAYSQTTEKLLKFFAPRVAFMKPDSNYLLLALKKTNTQTLNQPVESTTATNNLLY